MNLKAPVAPVLALASLIGISHAPVVLAQHENAPGQAAQHARHCTNATASGTYGYQMKGIIVGVGPFLVNGIYTHHPDGTMDADVQLVVGNATFPVLGTNGEFQTNPDCTGSGRFTAAPLPEVTYNFIATDGGEQIELLNTNQGIVLHGISRRISKPGKDPHCGKEMILGAYGYRLDGSLPGVPNVALAGIVRHSTVGTLSGEDTFNVMGQYLPRDLQGTFVVNANCRGAGGYTDSLGNNISYVFTVVNDGDTLFLQGADAGAAVSGVAQRVR